MNQDIDGCNKYLKEVVERVQKVLDMHSDFKFKLWVSKLKIKLNKRFEDTSRERDLNLNWPL